MSWWGLLAICEYVLYRMYARTRRDEGRRERQASNYGSPFLHTTETHSWRPNIANLPLDLRSILAMIVPVLVGPLAGHANSLSAPLQRPIRSVQSKYCESTMHPVYHAKITVSTKNFPRSEGRKCGVKGLVQWRGLMVWSRSWFRTTGKVTLYQQFGVVCFYDGIPAGVGRVLTDSSFHHFVDINLTGDPLGRGGKTAGFTISPQGQA